jgi:glycosyltransferase involved in cell wall biosynthesis
VRIGLFIYGGLETLCGEYLYDRKLVEYLRAHGDEVELVSIPWRSYAVHLLDNYSTRLFERLKHLHVDVLLQDECNHPSVFLLNQRLVGKVSYPIATIVHHLRSSEAHPSTLNGVYQRVERSYLNSVQGFIFNSRATQSAVAALLGKTGSGLVAYPGGDRFGTGLSAAAVAQRARRAGPLQILFVGNLIARKGLLTLVESLARLHSRGWLLHVIGRQDVDPGYTAAVKKLVAVRGIRDRVIFTGKLSENELNDAWIRSHLLAVPSQYEGFGIVYLEGMGFGLPAIGSTAGAAGEIIQDEVNGYLVQPEDAAGLAQRLEQMIDDRSQLEKMSLAALERFQAFPTWEQSAARIQDYLKSMLT